MSSECVTTLTIVSILIGRFSGDRACTDEEIDAAFRHLRRCAPCRSSLTPDERARFISTAILERE